MQNDVTISKLVTGERFVTHGEIEEMERRYEAVRSTWTEEQRQNECWGINSVLVFSDGTVLV
jgi:hypothetical protein